MRQERLYAGGHGSDRELAAVEASGTSSRTQILPSHPEGKERAETDVQDESKRGETSARPRVSEVSPMSKSSGDSLEPEFHQFRAAKRTPYAPARQCRIREPRERGSEARRGRRRAFG